MSSVSVYVDQSRKFEFNSNKVVSEQKDLEEHGFLDDSGLNSLIKMIDTFTKKVFNDEGYYFFYLKTSNNLNFLKNKSNIVELPEGWSEPLSGDLAQTGLEQSEEVKFFVINLLPYTCMYKGKVKSNDNNLELEVKFSNKTLSELHLWLWEKDLKNVHITFEDYNPPFNNEFFKVSSYDTKTWQPKQLVSNQGPHSRRGSLQQYFDHRQYSSLPKTPVRISRHSSKRGSEDAYTFGEHSATTYVHGEIDPERFLDPQATNRSYISKTEGNTTDIAESLTRTLRKKKNKKKKSQNNGYTVPTATPLVPKKRRSKKKHLSSEKVRENKEGSFLFRLFRCCLRRKKKN